MYQPGDCIRVSRVKYLCSTTSSTSSAVLVLHGTTSSTQAIQVHLRHNSVSRSMYAVPWIYDSDGYRTVHLHLTLTSLVVAHVHLHLTLTSPVVANLQCCIAQ